MQRVMEIPDELKGVSEAVSAMIRQVRAVGRSTQGGKAVDSPTIERQLAEGEAPIARARHRAVLPG